MSKIFMERHISKDRCFLSCVDQAAVFLWGIYMIFSYALDIISTSHNQQAAS